MPALKKGKPIGKNGHGIHVGAGGTGPSPSDEQITFTRVSPVRAAADPFKLGMTVTQDFVPSGSQSTAVANMKAAILAMNLDYVNMHSHHFGASGPWTNTDKNSGKTYADRATWTGWSSWDARLDHVRDCMGAASEIIITLLPPGWMKMDGGSKTNAGSDPLGAGRTWDNLDNATDERHTDAHRADMVSVAKAIALRHSDVAYFSVINEQKGNFTPSAHSTEISSDGLSNIFNYFEQERYQEALRTGLDAVGATGVEIIGPYLVLEGSGLDDLAVTYAGIGFPQPAASASVPLNKYRDYFATNSPLYSRTRTFLQEWLARTSSASRSNWIALDWKAFDGDNDTGNFEVLYPWRWYMLEPVRDMIEQVKTVTGYTGSDKIIAMESYARKVQDDAHVPSDQEQGAMLAELLRIELEAGAHAELRWAPEQGDAKPNRNNWFTSTKDTLASGGGVALPGYYAYKIFCDHFRGVNCYATTSSDEHVVTALANATETLLINHTANPVTVSVNGGTVYALSGHEFRVVTE